MIAKFSQITGENTETTSIEFEFSEFNSLHIVMDDQSKEPFNTMLLGEDEARELLNFLKQKLEQ